MTDNKWADRLFNEFSKDNNYNDSIPDGMKSELCSMVSRKDWEALTKFMQINVIMTRRECAKRAEMLLLEAERRGRLLGLEEVANVCEVAPQRLSPMDISVRLREEIRKLKGD